jgi:hypothetical protein
MTLKSIQLITGESIMKSLRVIAAILVLLLTSFSTSASGWRIGFGPSYISGIGDVVDLYEDNLEASGFVDVDTFEFPIGLAFDAHYEWESGLRAGFGIGPVVAMFGDADHTEIAANATIGYAFMAEASTSPYVKAGYSHHSVDGDYEISTDNGTLAAVGIEFSRNRAASYSLEIAKDTSEVTFRRVGNTNVTLNTYDVIVSFFVKF